MDSTPQDERVSELAGLDPADAVEPAQNLADELEASLAEPERSHRAEAPDDVAAPMASEAAEPEGTGTESTEADSPPA